MPALETRVREVEGGPWGCCAPEGEGKGGAAARGACPLDLLPIAHNCAGPGRTRGGLQSGRAGAENIRRAVRPGALDVHNGRRHGTAPRWGGERANGLIPGSARAPRCRRLGSVLGGIVRRSVRVMYLFCECECEEVLEGAPWPKGPDLDYDVPSLAGLWNVGIR